MRNYWTCSSFADWLRGTAKPGSATSQDWAQWRIDAKQAHPFRFWLAEEVLDSIQSFFRYIPERLNDVRYYINNRWISRSHALTSHSRDIKPGEWCDVGHRFLPCLFNELVNFVEIEQAWHHVLWDHKARAKFKTPWWRSGWLRWRTWRCPEAGIEHLTWASELKFDDQWTSPSDPKFGKPTPQAESAMEILFLYRWWTETYRNRPDAMEASGLSAIYSRERDETEGDDSIFVTLNRTRTKEEAEELDRASALNQEIEYEYEREDEEMMIRLIKVRQSLWT